MEKSSKRAHSWESAAGSLLLGSAAGILPLGVCHWESAAGSLLLGVCCRESAAGSPSLGFCHWESAAGESATATATCNVVGCLSLDIHHMNTLF